MEIIIILVIISIVISSVNKRNQEQKKRAQAQQARRSQRPLTPEEIEQIHMRQAEARRNQEDIFPAVTPPPRPQVRSQQAGTPQGAQSGSMAGASSEGRHRPIMATEAEKAQRNQPRLNAELSHRNVAAPMHVVKPITESAHTHMETSMTGFTDCQPVPLLTVLAEEEQAPAVNMEFSRSALVQGILYSEILGKPRALRRRA